jgi:hypothetical protein
MSKMTTEYACRVQTVKESTADDRRIETFDALKRNEPSISRGRG